MRDTGSDDYTSTAISAESTGAAMTGPGGVSITGVVIGDIIMGQGVPGGGPEPPEPSEPPGQPADRRAFVVASSRVPLDWSHLSRGVAEWGENFDTLATLLGPLLAPHRGRAAWVGAYGHDGSAVRPSPAPAGIPEIRMRRVRLTTTEVHDFYRGFCYSTLWPLYHDALVQPKYDDRWWEAYEGVNRRFADAIAAEAAEGATVWIHDYPLQLVPGMLRARRADLRIGYFLHIPFPSAEMFMRLPQRGQILRGLLGADLVGFQRALAGRNFLHLTRDLLGLHPQADDGTVEVDNRLVRIGAYPASIDFAHVESLATDPRVRRRAAQIRTALGDPGRVILSVDRLDFTKGIDARLAAFRELLAKGRFAAPGTVFVQVVRPSRESVETYQAQRERVEREVGHINGEFADVGAPAVHYVHRAYSRAELVALYLAADVMMVTPLRDGMNLVAKEYVAARTDGTGTLVLSEFAGAAGELRQAYLCNPHNRQELKDTLLRAVHADPVDATRRMAAMRQQVRDHDLTHWYGSFLSDLGATHLLENTCRADGDQQARDQQARDQQARDQRSRD